MSSEESTSDEDEEKANLTIYKLKDNYVVICLSNNKDQLSDNDIMNQLIVELRNEKQPIIVKDYEKIYNDPKNNPHNITFHNKLDTVLNGYAYQAIKDYKNENDFFVHIIIPNRNYHFNEHENEALNTLKKNNRIRISVNNDLNAIINKNQKFLIDLNVQRPIHDIL